MIKSYFKIGWRNLLKNKGHSLINVGGLALGMAVAMLIGLWIWDELSYNTFHRNHDRIASVMQRGTFGEKITTSGVIPLPLEAELNTNYRSDFKYIVMSTIPWNHTLSADEKNVTLSGSYISKEAPGMFSLEMAQGTADALTDPSSIMISRSAAQALFGVEDPMGELIKIDNHASFTVSGVYEDLPLNSSLRNVNFMAPWEYFRTSEEWLVTRASTDWDDDFLLMYVQVADGADMKAVSDKIKHIKRDKIGKDKATFNPELFLHPMNKWHLYSRFTNGVNDGGAIEYVWMFGIIGVFVLVLACINFMNLSTARSEKRAKETGLRKAIGSHRSQLINQFFCESLLTVGIAFFFSVLLIELLLPSFNQLAHKEIVILWSNPFFWLATSGFALFTGLIAGSYPAFYLSSFQPIKVLKGTFKTGRSASIPRKVLVVVQFTVSIILTVGTIVVFNQIQYSKNRPVGYSRSGLINIETTTNELHDHFDAVRAELLKSPEILEVAESSSPVTGVNNNMKEVTWSGKDPGMTPSFANIRVTAGYGKTVGWQFLDGRDFSSDIPTDAHAVILNESAVKYMGLANPIGEVVRVGRTERTVIGVVKDMVMDSPYKPVKQTLFYMTNGDFGYLNIRIGPAADIHDALSKIETICKAYAPSTPFTYHFADVEYSKKFESEERVGKLASFFAFLAIVISCLGLSGLASYVAEQRTKEIGIRKVMGASVISLWKMLSGDFILLIAISCLIAAPIVHYFMENWLEKFAYRTTFSWWYFAITGATALFVTLLTVSFQAIKAAIANPVRSLRSE